MRKQLFVIFLGGVFALGTFTLFLHTAPALSASCDFAAFLSCRDTFNLQGCIDACPYVDSACPPGTPPNTECKVTDPACSDACWDRGNTHGASCAASAGCTMEQIQILLRGGTIEDDSGSNPGVSEPPASPPPPAPPEQPKLSPQGLSGSTSEPEIFQTLDAYQAFWEVVEEVEALVETAPQPITVPLVTPEPAIDWPVPPRGLAYAVIKEITGNVEFQIEGQHDWQKVSVGMKIWNGSLIQTDFDAEATLDFEGIAVVKMRELTQISIEKFIKDRPEAKGAAMLLEIRLGDMNLDMNPGSFSADTQIRAGNITGGVSGTHFGVAYNPEAGVSTWEIYDGTIWVTNEKTGETIAMRSSYGEPIKRLEASDDGMFARQIAIPRDEWEARKEQFQAEAVDDNGGFKSAGALVILAIIAAAGLAFFFFKRRAMVK